MVLKNYYYCVIVVLALLLAAGTPSHSYSTHSSLPPAHCMTPLALDHLCLICCLRLVFIGDRDKQLALENLLSNPFPHPSLTNQRKLLQLSSASPNDPAFLPAAIPAACSQPPVSLQGQALFFFLPASSCNPIFKGS